VGLLPDLSHKFAASRKGQGNFSIDDGQKSIIMLFYGTQAFITKFTESGGLMLSRSS
jgi:hypothetical protein